MHSSPALPGVQSHITGEVRNRGTANRLGKRGLFMLLLFWSEQAVAQSGQAGQAEDRPVLRALRASQPIELDGRLNESVWQQAQPVTEFTQRDPREGTAA